MGRVCCFLLWGVLIVGPHLAAEVSADDQLTSSPATVLPPLPPSMLLPPGPLQANQTEQPVADSGTTPVKPSPSPASGQAGSSKQRGQNGWITALDRNPSELGPGYRSLVPGQFTLSPAQVRSNPRTDQIGRFALLDSSQSELGLGYRSLLLDQFSLSPGQVLSHPQTGQIGRLALLDGSPSELGLGDRSPVSSRFSLSPVQARSDPQPIQIGFFALQDGKPSQEGPGTQSTVTGPTRLPALLVRSDPTTGQSSWSTLVDGKPIDAEPGDQSADPGQTTPGRSETTSRVGYWGGGVSGHRANVGMYEGLSPSPFWDIDTIRSNGQGTVDLWASQLNSDSYDLRSHFFENGYTANVDFEQFPHLLQNQPLAGGSRQSSSPVVTDNLNVGEDSAIRVQQLKVATQGPLTDNIQWKLKFWMFHKFGERQVNSMAHCFNTNLVGGSADNKCHVLTQMQHIDWLTLEVEPGLVAKFDRVTVDYAHTMRYFTQNDQATYAPFNNFPGFGNGTSATIFPYAIVPDSMFQMDRLKLGVDLTKTLRIYSYLYNGDMLNLSRNTNNQFGGFDIRLIKTNPSGVTATAYVKMNENRSQRPPSLLPEEQADPGAILHPVNYTRYWAGLDGQWFPFHDAPTFWRGLSLRAGYEYHEVNYEYATYPTDIAAGYVSPPTVTNAVITTPYFTQPTTRTNQVVLAQRMRWTSGVNTFARYQFQYTENPLYGMTPLSGALNTPLPTEQQIFEFGGSWAPRPNLLLSARAEIQTMWQKSIYANGAENNYPVVFTLWYAPSPKLSISAGYSYFSNWVNQDVTFGYRALDEPPPAETLRLGYSGQTHVVNVGGRYAWSEKLLLMAGIFWTDGANIFSVPQSQTGANWSTMPQYSNVLVQTIRYQAGFDYKLSPKISAYFRVNVFDYQDNSQSIGTGVSYFFLSGLSGSF